MPDRPMTSDLLPCPFDGHLAVLKENHHHRWVECSHCQIVVGHQIKAGINKDSHVAENVWNDRIGGNAEALNCFQSLKEHWETLKPEHIREWIDTGINALTSAHPVQEIEGLEQAIEAHRELYDRDIFRVEEGNKNFSGMNKDRPKKSPSSIVLEAAMAYAALAKGKTG